MKTTTNNKPYDAKRNPPAAAEMTVRQFRLDLETVNEQDRSVEAVIATEGRVQVYDWNRGLIEEVLVMSGCKLPASRQVPLCDTHSRQSIQTQLGSTQDLRIEGDKLIGRNVFSSKPVAQEAFTMVKEGHLTDNSIGYRVTRHVVIEAGETAEIEGRTWTASPEYDLRIALEWTVKENSVCPIGADEAAKHRGESRPNSGPNNNRFNTKGSKMDFNEWLQKRGLDAEQLDQARRDELLAEYKAETASRSDSQPKDGSAAAPAQRTAPAGRATELGGNTDGGTEASRYAEDAIRAERERCRQIRELGGDDVDPAIINRAIDGGESLEHARAAVLEYIRANRPQVPASSGPAIHTGAHEMRTQTLEDAMLLRGGYDDIVVSQDPSGNRAGQAETYRDTNLVDLCRFCLRLDGIDAPVGRDEMVKRALFSSTSLPSVLANVAEKAMLKGYQIRTTFEPWTSRGTLPDFKAATRARLVTGGEFEEVGANGELAIGNLSDEGETYSLTTYGRTWSITRQTIINDDAGAFTRFPMMAGNKGIQRISKLVYTHLLANGNMADGTALFDSDHNNLNTTNPLDVDGLATAIAEFRKQVDGSGEPIDIDPAYLIVPPELENTARGLVESDMIMLAVGADASTKHPMKNIFRGTLGVIVEPRLSNSNYTGYSTEDWYLAADPTVADTIEVGYLNGKAVPTIERLDAGNNVLGITFRCYIDAGAKAVDWRGLQKNDAS